MEKDFSKVIGLRDRHRLADALTQILFAVSNLIDIVKPEGPMIEPDITNDNPDNSDISDDSDESDGSDGSDDAGKNEFFDLNNLFNSQENSIPTFASDEEPDYEKLIQKENEVLRKKIEYLEQENKKLSNKEDNPF